MAEMNEKMVELADVLLKAAEAYFTEYEVVNGKEHPVMWLDNSETGAFVAFTRGEYKERIKQYIDSGMNFVL